MSASILVRTAACTLGVSCAALVDAWRGKLSVRSGDEKLDQWSAHLLHQVKAKLHVRGSEHVDAEASYVVMSNHQSHYDIPVLFQALPLSLRMVAKAELFKIPVWSEAMRVAGFIAIDRSRGREAMRTLLEAGERLKREHTSLWIAPEGTRSRDGTLGDFKKGGFRLAQATELPILPVSIQGTMGILRAGTSRVHTDQTVDVTIAPPIDPRAYAGRLSELIRDVRQTIARPLAGG